MNSQKKKLFIFLFFVSFLTNGQITNFKEKFTLPSKVDETSGLLFFNNKIITHNDSGDSAKLYEIDSLSGNLTRTITISNASNKDWEDITEDENHIYIADIGNNNGTRKDLKIYKISKDNYKTSTSVSAETISFAYEDQANFSSSNNHNFDSEAIVVVDNSILIFTKNRGDLKTNVYKIPTTAGTYTATKISSANVEGLITGATYNGNFLLCGYDSNLIPFLVQISVNRIPGDNIFASGFTKESLFTQLSFGCQVEGITSYAQGKYYISRELVETEVNGQDLTFEQKLFEFYDERDEVLSLERKELDIFSISPNPTSDKININTNYLIDEIIIYNTLGKKVMVNKSNKKQVSISHLPKGIYILKVNFQDSQSLIKKIIKL
jgi:hypothetical protein